jgi:outer membrane protein OmpA-like peptidoglycan-associated protein
MKLAPAAFALALLSVFPCVSRAAYGVSQDPITREYVFCENCPAPTRKVLDLPSQPASKVAATQSPMPATAPVVNPLPPAKVRILRIAFGFDSSALSKNAMDAIKEFVVYDLAVPGSRSVITITGSTDKVGARRHNKLLALRRARAVRDALVRMNVAKDRIKVVAKCCVDFPPSVNPGARRAVVTSGN